MNVWKKSLVEESTMEYRRKFKGNISIVFVLKNKENDLKIT